jgi:hypothetical protein
MHAGNDRELRRRRRAHLFEQLRVERGVHGAGVHGAHDRVVRQLWNALARVRSADGDLEAVGRVHEYRPVQSGFDAALWYRWNADLRFDVSVAEHVSRSVVCG